MADTKDLVLIVDDNPLNIQYLGSLLAENGYKLAVSLNGENALEFAKNHSPDLILLDILMPGMDGFTVCQKLQQNPETKAIPVIFTTAKADEDSIEKAYDTGGRDYVTKPIKPKELLARVKTHLELRRVLNHLQFTSTHDQLTGLYNRAKLDNSLANEIARAIRYSRPLCAIIIDIDHFKMVNDKLGHQAGDKVLRNVATVISDNLRSVDIAGRWGGEEFLILCPETSIDDAVALAEKLRLKIENASVNGVSPTCSLGVGQLADPETGHGFIGRVDLALYQAKKNGRNQVQAAK